MTTFSLLPCDRTRLAFADLLIEDGAPISLILDDPLAYSDDARLETMTDILLEGRSF